MAAAARGLTPADLTGIRDALAAGRKPKVVFTSAAGQMAGNAGQVVELADPAASDEWIVVQFGRDQLPFSPTDLAIPVRAAAGTRATKRTEAKAPPREATPREATPREALAKDGPGKEAKETAAKRTPAPAPGPPLLPPAPAPTPVPVPRKEAAVQSEPVNGTSNGVVVVKPPAKVAKPKVPASLVVTLSYIEKEWTVAATQGSRSLAKPYVIRPTEALRMVALIDVPGVHDAVENIIAAERSEAEHRAVRLREELAEIESRLAELSAKG
jgi:hypothetical protein